VVEYIRVWRGYEIHNGGVDLYTFTNKRLGCLADPFH
jgi:hypothetical protein